MGDYRDKSEFSFKRSSAKQSSLEHSIFSKCLGLAVLPKKIFKIYMTKKTKKSVNHSVKVVRECCREKGSNVEFEKLDPKELDEYWLFYVDLRKKDGELYTSSAFSLYIKVIVL